MKKPNCGERRNREDVDVFYVRRRPWQTYWYPRNSRGEAMFEQDNYKTLCSAQKRRIAIMLSSVCDYCINQLTTNKYIYNIFTSGGSFHFNHPLICPQILISNQAKEKLNLAYRELKDTVI